MNIFLKDAQKRFKLNHVITQHVNNLYVKFELEKVKQNKVIEFLVKII